MILIVEDEADIRENLVVALELAGKDVVSAANGQAALDWLRASGTLPVLILLDLMMPVMDGWQFRKQQLADAGIAGIPVIVMSGAEDVRREATAMGVAGYITKPFKLKALLSVVTGNAA